MGRAPDVAIISLATTLGLRYADDALGELIRHAGATCQVVRVDLAGLAHLRRGMLLTDVVESYGARRSAAGVRAGSFIYSSVTAALLQPPRPRYAVRFDSLAAANRPGWAGAWQRRRETNVLASAELLIPWSDSSAGAGRFVGTMPCSVVLPPPVEGLPYRGSRNLDAVAYAANPEKRGLDLLCRAWLDLAPRSSRLLIGGLDSRTAKKYLAGSDVAEPAAVEWLGRMSRGRWLDLVAQARVFIDASRYQEWGLAQMEALSLGTPLVTVPSGGSSEALPLVRQLCPRLVASDRTVGTLSTAIGHALALNDAERRAYADDAVRLLAPYRTLRLRRVVAEEILPALLPSS